jgi:tripeptidyl-peptidase I
MKEAILHIINYALPSALHRHIQTVTLTTYFGSPGTLQQRVWVHCDRAVTTWVDSGHKELVTPSSLRSLYKSEEYVPSATDKNVLRLTGFQGKYTSHHDLEFMDEIPL